MLKFSEVTSALSAWFPSDAHKERPLPGGGRWFYVPWMLYIDRLNAACPDDWEVAFSDPKFANEFCYVTCTLIVCGQSRQGIGAVPIEVKGERGNCIERAVAESLKNAGELFGIGSYLDEQTDPKTKAAFVKYMQQSGDGRAAANYHASDRPKSANKAIVKPFGQTPKPVGNNLLDSIDEAQAKHLWQTAQAAGYSEAGARSLLAGHGFDSFKSISRAKYNTILEDASDRVLVDRHNEAGKALKPASSSG